MPFGGISVITQGTDAISCLLPKAGPQADNQLSSQVTGVQTHLSSLVQAVCRCGRAGCTPGSGSFAAWGA